jgi:hypothetical protein
MLWKLLLACFELYNSFLVESETKEKSGDLTKSVFALRFNGDYEWTIGEGHA